MAKGEQKFIGFNLRGRAFCLPLLEVAGRVSSPGGLI